jgi:hypothetical protein
MQFEKAKLNNKLFILSDVLFCLFYHFTGLKLILNYNLIVKTFFNGANSTITVNFVINNYSILHLSLKKVGAFFIKGLISTNNTATLRVSRAKHDFLHELSNKLLSEIMLFHYQAFGEYRLSPKQYKLLLTPLIT